MHTLIQLYGSKYEMGCQYGRQARKNLENAYSILYSYLKNRCVPDDKIAKLIEEFYARVPEEWKSFVEAEASCAQMDLMQAKALLAMGPLYALSVERKVLDGCTFFYIGQDISENNHAIIGRNYDFHTHPYSEITKDLLITVLNEPGTTPTAFISLPGQVYCLTCINQDGIFASINNGMVSGGSITNDANPLVMSNVLTAVQHSKNIEQLELKFSAIKPDYSVIVNYANATNVGSFEFSSICGAHKASIDQNHKFMVSTNFYHDNNWCNFDSKQPVTDHNSWLGITRKQNIETMIESQTLHNATFVTSILDAKLEQGGATTDYTIYQIAYDTGLKSLLIKTIHDDVWINITLFD